MALFGAVDNSLLVDSSTLFFVRSGVCPGPAWVSPRLSTSCTVEIQNLNTIGPTSQLARSGISYFPSELR